MNRCETCGKVFHHSLILPNGAEAQQCLECATAAPVDVSMRAQRESLPGSRPHHGHEQQHAHGDGEHAPHHSHHHYDERDEQWKAWVAAGVLSIVAFLLVYGIWSQNANEQAAAQQEATAVANFLQEVKGYDLGKPDGARAALRRVEAMQDLWVSSVRAGEVQSVRDRASATLRAHDTMQQIGGRLQALAQALQGPALGGKQLGALHAEAVALTGDARTFDGDVGGRVGAMQARTAERYLQQLHAEAAACTGAAALCAFGRAEAAAVEMDRQAQQNRVALTPVFFTLRERLASESDAVCKQVVTPEYLARVPADDLLAPGQKDAWRSSATEGLLFRLQGGALAVENRAGGGARTGVVAIGYNEGWRDFVLEFDCAVQSGQTQLYLRLSGAADAGRVPNVSLTPAKCGRGRIEVLGDSMRVLFDGAPERVLDVSKQQRIGGIGIVVPPGSAATFTRFSLQKVR